MSYLAEVARRKKTQQKPECWWCDRPEASNEDVVPRWVGRKYPEPANWIHENAHPELGFYRVKKARKPAVKSRKFCEKCNNGWMGTLEEEVIPVLEPMMHGGAARLTEEDQRLLALWVAKTIFAFQTLQRESYRFIPRHLYKELFQEKAPPSGCQIWLGSRAPGESVAWHRAHSLRREEENGSGFGATLALGAVVAHLIWHDLPDQQLKPGPDLRSSLVQIWPIRRSTRLWPPPQRISGRDLSWFAQAMTAGSQLVPV